MMSSTLSTTLFLLSMVAASERAESVVERWFLRQPSEWARALDSCQQLVVLFADERWLAAARTLTAELERYDYCVAHYVWAVANRSAVCERPLCYVDDDTGVDSEHWGTPLYFVRIDQRVPLLAALMRRLPVDSRRGLALVDADVVVQRNVLARFVRSNATLAIQQEWPCATAPLQLCANGGFYWLRRVPAALALLARVERLMHRLRLPDQDALDVALARGRFGRAPLVVDYLDRLLYANGYTMQHDARFDAAGAHIVHVNWLPSREHKLAALRRLRANRLPAKTVY
jgi:hypothetical protein